MNVKIVIPIYKNQLSYLEERALDQAYKIFVSHPLVVIKPENLDLSSLSFKYPRLTFESFDDSFLTEYQVIIGLCFQLVFMNGSWTVVIY